MTDIPSDDDRTERAAIALVTVLGQDWPVEEPQWKPETVAHWREYKASWREAAGLVLAAADGGRMPGELCPTCGANMKRAVAGRCVQEINHPRRETT